MKNTPLRGCAMHCVLLLFAALASPGASSQTLLNDNIRRAEQYFALLDAKDTYSDNLNRVDMNMLPSGFRQTINNMDVTIAVYGAGFHTGYVSFDAFLRLIVPGETKKILFFGANDLKLSHQGDIIGDAELSLLNDLEIPVAGGNIILRLKGGFNAKTGQSERLTYVGIDCQGFKSLGLTAEVELSPGLCLPVDDKGQTMPQGKVCGRFQTEIENWDEIVASVSFPPFSINGLEGFIWNVRNAVFDFSGLKNGEGFRFPEAYRPYIILGHETLWQGVYVESLTVTLPPCFAQADEKRVSFGARDMLIDDNGITGLFHAENLLAFDQGSAGGWAFSVNRFGVELVANHLEGITFGGEIGLPVSESTRLGYDGFIMANDTYMLRVNPIDGFSFDMLQAKAELYENSYVELKVEHGKFKPEAMLHGRMSIAARLSSDGEGDGGKEIAQFKGVEFRGLRLKTENPFLSVEYLGYHGEVKLLNFPVSIDNIAMNATGREAALTFGLKLALMDGDLGASTRLSISGKIDEGRLQRWKYETTSIEQVRIKSTLAETFTLEGGLAIMHNDPIYGDGFGGNLNVSFEKKSPLNGLKVDVRGMFGHTGFRYWFVDGIATLPGDGIPVATGLFLNGFGGGVSYRMKPAGIESRSGTVMSATSMAYTPDKEMGLGIKAAVAFVVGKEEIANGEACFELAFNTRGGLSYAGFYGFAEIAKSMPGAGQFDKIAKENYRKIIAAEEKFTGNNEALTETLKRYKQYEPQKAAEIISGKKEEAGQGGLRACVGIQYDFSKSSFHATFDLYANLLSGMIRGSGQGNRAGYAVLHIDPSDWYVHMGTPTDRIGLKIGFGNILHVETGSYLMAGTVIPPAPGVPEQVASILGYKPADLDYMKDLNLLAAGKGFAFGSRLSIDTGDLQFLILYARYSAGMGYDIMLRDYGEAECKGRSGAIGLNGWYANGQAYAYMQGELGAKINLWFMKAKVPILRADIAALMQAKLPNPSSFKAYLAVKAKVLGLVSVNCRFKILIGEDCELVIPGGSPLDMAMISDLSPADASNEVSVFTAPQATFNMAVGKTFEVQDDSGEKRFRIQLGSFTLSDGADIKGELKWNADRDAVSFYTHEVLPPEKEVTATVNVVFEELRGGKWAPVYTAGREAVESKTIRFRTAGAPDYIPLQNVTYAYPVAGQRYFLKGEGEGKGYIRLRHGQSYLFPAELKNQILFEDRAGNKIYADFIYNEPLRRIDFNMPEINHTTGYSVSVVSLSTGGGTASGGQVSQTLLGEGEDGSISVESKTASAVIRTDLGKVLLSYDFTSSRYSTFAQKINALQKTRATAVGISSDVLMFGYETADMEPFDAADLSGTEQTEQKPLVDVTATLEDEYYLNRIYPLIYRDYLVDGLFRVKRTNVESTGVPPAKALPIRTDYLNRIEQGIFDGITTGRFPYYYNLPAVYKEDFTDLQNQTVNAFVTRGKSSAAANRFLTGSFPFILPGTYRIEMQYILPGGVKGSRATFDYSNFIQ